MDCFVASAPRNDGTRILYGFIADISGILDHPLSRMMTAGVLRAQFDRVIPGRCEASNPESRNSGSGATHHPGMTLSRHPPSRPAHRARGLPLKRVKAATPKLMRKLTGAKPGVAARSVPTGQPHRH